MNTKRVIKLNFIVWLFIFIILLAISTYFNYALNQEVPNMIEYKKINSNGIKFEKLNEVKEKYKEVMFTAYDEVSDKVKNKYDVLPGKDIKTKMVLTDENFFNIYPYKFIEGGKLEQSSIKNGDRSAVISDNLATQLYKSTKVLGNIISIGDNKYKIVGVYRTNKSFNYGISDDGYDRVMVPYSAYTSPNKKEDLSIDVFATRETSQNTPKKINNKLTQILGSNLSLYNMLDYTLSKKISFQYVKILYFIMGICAIVVLIKLLVKHLKGFNGFFKEKLEDNYFEDSIKENKKDILIMSAKTVLYLVCIIVIFNVVKFNILIKDNYLPASNIFDLDFYTKTIVKNMQLINANESGFSNVYNRYSANISGMEKILLISEIVAFIFAFINGKALIKGKGSNTDEVK